MEIRFNVKSRRQLVDQSRGLARRRQAESPGRLRRSSRATGLPGFARGFAGLRVRTPVPSGQSRVRPMYHRACNSALRIRQMRRNSESSQSHAGGARYEAPRRRRRRPSCEQHWANCVNCVPLVRTIGFSDLCSGQTLRIRQTCQRQRKRETYETSVSIA